MDSPSAVQQFAASVAEAAGITDVANAQAVINVIVAEFAGALDAAAALGTFNAAVAEAVGAHDAPLSNAQIAVAAAVERAGARDVAVSAKHMWEPVDDNQAGPWVPVPQGPSGPWAPVVDAQVGPWVPVKKL